MDRCKWARNLDELYIQYHDKEWGTPVHNDQTLYEMLILELFQAGLSWNCILKKRKNFEKAFDYFNIEKVIKYDDKKILELQNNQEIVRNKLKINATINNTNIFKKIQKEYKTFDNYIWSFTNYKTIYETNKTSSELSDKISKDLKSKGMKFIGTIIIYSYLQSIGIINSHEQQCFRYKKVVGK